MKKNRNFKAKMVPEEKNVTLAFFIIQMSQLYITLFLFIAIRFNQYFGVENAKTAENQLKLAKIHIF